MAVKIAHAVGDENGKARGGEAGDQTGKEVLVANWYKRTGGWDVCIECTDEQLASDAADIAIRIANNDSFGYDQDQRTTALSAIKAAGGVIEDAKASELDCSVLVFASYQLAGLDIAVGYTGNLEARFLATGKFVSHRESKYLDSGEYAKKGWIYLTAGKHTAIVVTDGSKSCATDGGESETDADYASEADQIDPPYIQIKGKVNVRDMGGWTLNEKGKKVYNGKVIYTAKDEKLPFEEFDADSGWYGVQSPAGAGFVSCDLPRNAILVES